jgi:catechol 2,3-dioxygenase-like lactoylglutathione lyase family enzyme
MKQQLMHISLVVRDYDEAIAYYTQKLNFQLLEDSYQAEQNKRWVVIAPPGDGSGCSIVLARASTPTQMEAIGNQTGGRVFLFLQTDNFWRDYHNMAAAGITFTRAPVNASYGTVAVFSDLYGNLWDLIGTPRD